MISLSWVLVPGFVGVLLARSTSMLPAYLFATLACIMCLGLIAAFLPRQSGTDKAATRHLSYLAALAEVISPRVFIRVIAVSLISSTLHVNGAILPLIVTGSAHGTVGDVGILVGIVAFLEVVFIVVWGRVQRIMNHVTALAIGTIIYVVYLVLLGFAAAPWHVYALTLISGIGAAALISIPITYLQDLIAERPGLGSALISVNIFLSAGLSALLFAIGTGVSALFRNGNHRCCGGPLRTFPAALLRWSQTTALETVNMSHRHPRDGKCPPRDRRRASALRLGRE